MEFAFLALTVIRNHPSLAGLDIPATGQPGRVGILVTKTLVIVGEGCRFTDENGEASAWFRAYDKVTGEQVGTGKINGIQL